MFYFQTGYNPIMVAVVNNQAEVVNMLIKHTTHFDINQVNEVNNMGSVSQRSCMSQ